MHHALPSRSRKRCVKPPGRSAGAGASWRSRAPPAGHVRHPAGAYRPGRGRPEVGERAFRLNVLQPLSPQAVESSRPSRRSPNWHTMLTAPRLPARRTNMGPPARPLNAKSTAPPPALSLPRAPGGLGRSCGPTARGATIDNASYPK